MSASPISCDVTIADIFPVTLSRRLWSEMLPDSRNIGPFSPAFNVGQQTADHLRLRSGRFARKEALEVEPGLCRLPYLEVEDTEIERRGGDFGMRRVGVLASFDLRSRFISFPLGEELIRPERTIDPLVEQCTVSQFSIARALRSSGSKTFDLSHRAVKASFPCIDARRNEVLLGVNGDRW